MLHDAIFLFAPSLAPTFSSKPFLDLIIESQRRLLPVLWESIGNCLERGVIPVKIHALDVAARFLRQDGLPEAHLADNFVNIVLDLVYYVFENQNDVECDGDLRRELCLMEVKRGCEFYSRKSMR